jgi:nucleotide-binding universal stress UspA family protein
MASGPVVIGFDGTPAAERAVREAGDLLAPRPAVVVVAIEAGRAFGAVLAGELGAGLPVTELEVRNALRAEDKIVQQARRMAQNGAALAQEAGLKAEGLAVADDVPVATTLLRVADEQDAPVIVVGAPRLAPLAELLLGSTAKDLLKRSGRPVLVVRDATAGGAGDGAHSEHTGDT